MERTERIRNLRKELLSDNWATLHKVEFDFLQQNGEWVSQQREAYDRGNGAVILLYNPEQKTFILTRQLRIATYLNGNKDGMMIECCAGILDDENPEDCIRREIEEETGYDINQVKKVFNLYMSPGSVTEILYFFIGQYNSKMKTSDGGGAQAEQEDIEVIEVSYADAYDMIGQGKIKDAKTVLLLQYFKLNFLNSPDNPS